jgi:hypothetical protein
MDAGAPVHTEAEIDGYRSSWTLVAASRARGLVRLATFSSSPSYFVMPGMGMAQGRRALRSAFMRRGDALASA